MVCFCFQMDIYNAAADFIDAPCRGSVRCIFGKRKSLRESSIPKTTMVLTVLVCRLPAELLTPLIVRSLSLRMKGLSPRHPYLPTSLPIFLLPSIPPEASSFPRFRPTFALSRLSTTYMQVQNWITDFFVAHLAAYSDLCKYVIKY